MSVIDLSKLPAPTVVESLSFEAILAEMVADYQVRYPEHSADLESDPAYKILETAAYRELILRQQVNDAARAVMLAFAGGADLDHLGALQNVERLLVDPGDPGAIPPIDPTYESDDRLRQRVQLAPEGQSTAGPTEAYAFHALSAAADILDVDVSSPAATQVAVTVLSELGNGAPDQGQLDAVTAALTDRKVRPLTDQVTVQAAAIIEYTVAATLYVYEGPDPEVVRQASLASGQKYVSEHHRLGHDITLSGLHAALHLPGVQRVELVSSLPLPIAVSPQQAAYCTNLTVVIGGVDE